MIRLTPEERAALEAAGHILTSDEQRYRTCVSGYAAHRHANGNLTVETPRGRRTALRTPGAATCLIPAVQAEVQGVQVTALTERDLRGANELIERARDGGLQFSALVPADLFRVGDGRNTLILMEDGWHDLAGALRAGALRARREQDGPAQQSTPKDALPWAKKRSPLQLLSILAGAGGR